jgi:hypothetical protein
MPAATTVKELGRLTKAQLLETIIQQSDNFSLLEERLVDLELELEDLGWIKEAADSEDDFSKEGLKKLIELSRIMYLKNPLIHHACDVQTNYVWARGATFTAPTEQVDEIVQGFLNNRQNLVEFSSHEARIAKELQLQQDGNIFFVLWVSDGDQDEPEDEIGHVYIRTLPVQEILDGDIIYNPDDDREVWYYKRVYSRKTLDLDSGRYTRKKVIEFYPDWRYFLKLEELEDSGIEVERPTRIGSERNGGEVRWNAPVYHLKAGGLPTGRWGVPQHYSAFSWARAVTKDLEDYATIRRALAKFVFKMSVEGGKNVVKDARTRLQSGVRALPTPAREDNPAGPAGQVAIVRKGLVDLEPVKTAGVQPSPEEGRRLWLMVSAGTGIPETILSGNADVGNLATAKTLDRPTELQMQNRQTLWADVFRDTLGFVISRTMKLTNKIPDRVKVTRQMMPTKAAQPGVPNEPEIVTETQDTDLSINVEFPSILERDPKETVAGIVDAATLMGRSTAKTMPDRVLVDLLLRALGLNEEVSDILEDMFPDGAMWFPEAPEPALQPGQFDPNTGEQVPAPGTEGLPRPQDINLEEADEDKFRRGLIAMREVLTGAGNGRTPH